MARTLIIYNFAQKYRTAIFSQIEKTWDCKWMFGKNTTDIKGMDLSILKDVELVDNIPVMGSIYRQSNIVKEANKEEYDKLIMLGEPFNLSIWTVLLRNKLKRRKKKIFLWSHGWYGRESFAKKWMKRIFFGLADKTFLYGNYANEVAISQGFPAEKLAVIHNSLDHDNQVKLRNSLKSSSVYRDHFGNNYPTLIFIGRLTTVKRLDLLIDALAILKSEGKNCNLVLVGDGERKKSLEILTKEKGLEKVVWFYGACYDDTQNAQLIYDADLCVAPGNVGLTAMHTMVFGTPVLTHDNFSFQMPEFEAITPGKTGCYFKYDDLHSLAATISNWLSYSMGNRDNIRTECYKEIDLHWTPKFQLDIIKESIGV